MSSRTARTLAFGLAMLTTAGVAVAQEKLAYFRIKGPVPEAPQQMEISLLGGPRQSLSMFELLKRLDKLRRDNEISGLVLDLDEAQLGFAQIQELRAQFEKLKSADKDIWVYSESMMPGQYLLASAASKVILMPKGDVFLLGLHSEGMYMKRMFDKVGLQADIIHCGDYKSAGEPFYLEGPSRPAEEQQNRLLDSIYAQMIDQIAESRKISKEEVRKHIDHCILSAEEAKNAKLVDDLMYREDLRRTLKKRYGDDVQLVRNYGKEKPLGELDLGDPLSIFKLFGKLTAPKQKSSKSAVAVIYVDSMITSGDSESGLGGSNSGSTTVAKALRKAADDDSVKAVVLRVDSPGGSATASEVICEALRRCKKEKPVIVSMGDVAASGGYYVSCLADTIYAEPGTITGSIGVVGGKIVTKGLWDWMGISWHEWKRGQRADLFNTNRKFEPDQRQFIEAFMNRVYDDFKGRVTSGRGKKLKGEIESLAGGRVYTGEQALKIGLIDKLGGLSDAIEAAAEKAELPRGKYDVRVLPEQKNPLDMLIKALTGQEDDDDNQLEVRLTGAGLLTPPMQAMLATLEAQDPHKAAAVRRALRQVELLARENVLLLDASIPTLR